MAKMTTEDLLAVFLALEDQPVSGPKAEKGIVGTIGHPGTAIHIELSGEPHRLRRQRHESADEQGACQHQPDRATCR